MSSSVLDTLDFETLIDLAEQDDSGINQGSADDQILEQALHNDRLNSVDIYTGAPANVRASVGAAQTREDKLATLQNFYPDAIPAEIFAPKEGAARFGDGNFIYTDPETQKLMAFDESNRLFGLPIPFTARDLLDVGPEVAETVGAIGGAMAAGIPTAAATIPTMGPASIAPIGAAIMAGEGLGAATAREAYIASLDFFGETEDNRTGLQRLYDFGFTGSMNAFMGPLISKLFRGVKGYAGGKIRYDNGVNTPDADEMLKMMEDVGVTNPTVGQVTGNPVANVIETALAAMPASTKIMQQSARDTVNQLDDFAATLTYKYGGARTYSQAANELVVAAKRANTAFRTESDRLYSEVGRLLPEGQVSSAIGISDFVNKYAAVADTKALKKTYAPAMRQAQNLLSDQQSGKLTFEVLKDFRTSLGDNLADAKFRGAMSAQDRKLDEFYGVVSKELDAMLVDAGPEAKAAFDAANKYTREKLADGTGTIKFVREVIRKGKNDATDALDFALNPAKMGKSGNRLAKLKSELTPEEWDVMSGYMIGQMGLPSASRAGVVGVREGAIDATEVLAEKGFSPKSFVTRFGKLSEEAKKVLFSNEPELMDSLTNFGKVLERVAKSAEDMANPSGTARVYGAMGMFSPAAVGAGVEVLTGVGSVYDAGFLSILAAPAAAKLMTNPRFVNWMAEGVETAAYNPNSMGQHVRRLVQIYQLEPGIRDEIQAIAVGHQGEALEPIKEHQSKNQNEEAPEVENEISFRGVSTGEVSNKLMPDAIRPEEMQARMTATQPMQNDMPLFEDLEPSGGLASMGPAMGGFDASMSPTVVPSASDREIAERMKARSSGIAGLSGLV